MNRSETTAGDQAATEDQARGSRSATRSLASRSRPLGVSPGRLAALEKANAELLRSNAELVEFASVAAHELRAPLQTILGYAELLATRADPEGRENPEGREAKGLDLEDRECLAGIQRSAGRLSDLVDGLLSYARVGTTVRNRIEVELDGLLRESLELLEAQVRASGASVTADPLPTVIGDPGELAQVLHNLLANALAYRRPDVAPEIHLDAHRVETRWQIQVTDNGVGIEPAARERVFRVFQRVAGRGETGGTGGTGGSGIGLSVCRRIVEGHGGTIWAEANPAGPGTRLCFTVPVPVCWSPF